MIFVISGCTNRTYIPSSLESTSKEQLATVYSIPILGLTDIASIDGIPVRESVIDHFYKYYLLPGTHNVTTKRIWIRGECASERAPSNFLPRGATIKWVYSDTGLDCRPGTRGRSKTFAVELEAGKEYTFRDIIELGGPSVQNFIKNNLLR